MAAVVAVVSPVLADPGRRSSIEGGKRVGGFELGRKFSDYSKVLGSATKTTQSDVSDDAKLVYYKQYGLWFLVKKDLVNGITVASPLFTTVEGVKIGSTPDDVVRCYGQPESTGRTDYVRYPEKGLAFSYENGRVSRIYVVDKEQRDLARGDARIVPGSRAGGLQLGQHIDFVLKQWKNPSKRVAIPNRPGMEWWSYQNKGVMVVVNNGRLGGLRIFSPDFRTGQDIHVGSTRGDVLRVFGKPTRKDEALEEYPARGIGFVFDEDDKVSEIWIVESEEKGGK